MNYKGRLGTPGYAYRYCGGDATYAILPQEVMLMNCLLEYKANCFFYGSLSEPLSCIVGAFHAQYHTVMGSYQHQMGIVEGGNLAILAGAGPMGLGAIDYAIHCDRKPGLLVVTDIDQARLDRAQSIYTVEEAAKNGVKLIYLNTSGEDPVAELKALTDGKGFDDVFVFAPVAGRNRAGRRDPRARRLPELLRRPHQPEPAGKFNFYNVHYASTHIVGTSGGNTADMIEALGMIAKGTLKPAGMITHIGGLDAAAEATKNLPKIPAARS